MPFDAFDHDALLLLLGNMPIKFLRQAFGALELLPLSEVEYAIQELE